MTDLTQIKIANALQRIADALDRAYPHPKETPKKKKVAPSIFKTDILLVIDFVNEKTGRGFSAYNPNGRITSAGMKVRSILQKGYTVQQIKTVVAYMARLWRDDDKMSKYLTPDTLFRPSKFEKYLGEINGG